MKSIAMTTILFSIKPRRLITAAGLLCVLFFCLSGGGARAQADEDAKRLAELAKKIQEQMKAIDEKLLEAGSGRTVKAAGNEVDRILDDIRRMHEKVIRDIEELIRNVKYAPPSASSSQGGQQKPQEKNQPRREEPRAGDLQKNPTKPEDMEGQPKDGGRSRDDPNQEEARTRPPSADSEKARHTDASGRWGLLPPKVQEEILNSNVEDFPQKYRKWLEEYYRRAAERK